MKKAFVGLLAVCSMVASVAHTQETTQVDRPCKRIVTACEAAGFKKGEHKDKKALFVDCAKPLMAGQSVPGVSVASADIEACKTKRANRHK